MANFWNDSENKAITTTGEFTSGGTIENIPDKGIVTELPFCGQGRAEVK